MIPNENVFEESAKLYVKKLNKKALAGELSLDKYHKLINTLQRWFEVYDELSLKFSQEGSQLT